MATVLDMLENLAKINIDKIVKISMGKTSAKMILEQKNQMLSGKKSNNKLIGKYKSKIYAEEKYQKNSKAGYGNVDLRYTGRFQDSITLDIGGENYEFDSTDGKTEGLEAKYSEDIFGLTDDSKENYINNALLPEMQAEIKEITGLSFKNV